MTAPTFSTLGALVDYHYMLCLIVKKVRNLY